MDESDDFLDLITCGEETAYKNTFEDCFEWALLNESSTQCSSSRADADDRLELNAWRVGVRKGVELAGELCCYYGMVLELLEFEKSQTMSPCSLAKRYAAIMRTAHELHDLLIISPGILFFEAEKPQIRFDQHTFDHNITVIRNKAKQLNSLLDIHNVGESLNSLSF